MQEMNTEELATFHDNLSDLVGAGKEDEARDYLNHHMPRLPEDLQNEILGLMFFNAIVEEAHEIETIADMQEEGLSAIKALEIIKRKIQEEKRGK